MDLMEVRRTMMGVIAGMAGSSYKKIHTEEVAITATNTTAENAATLHIPATAYSSDKIVYVKVRDKVGKRNGYFYGCDTYIFNPFPANGATSVTATAPNVAYTYTGDKYGTTFAQQGIFAYSLNKDGELIIRKRYSSTYTGTIDSTYVIDVYLLEWPNDESPFDA